MKNRKQIETEVKNEIAKLKPYVKSLLCAAKIFDSSPSIANGSRRQTAREDLFNAIHDTAQTICENWHNEYSKIVSKGDMDEIFRRGFDSVTFEDIGECECWKGVIGISNIGEGV